MNTPAARTSGRWVDALVVSGGLGLLALGLALFFSNIPVGTYLFGWVDSFDLQPVARVGTLQGAARRKAITHSEFNPVTSQTVLYNFDTIVTDPDSQTTLQLDDGGTIELGPRTMVKLVFERRLDWAELFKNTLKRTSTDQTQKAHVTVVSGSAKIQPRRVPISLASAKSSAAAASAPEPQTQAIAVERAIQTIAVVLPTPTPLPSPIASVAPVRLPVVAKPVARIAPPKQPPPPKKEMLVLEPAPFGTTVKIGKLGTTIPVELKWKHPIASLPVEITLLDVQAKKAIFSARVDALTKASVSSVVRKPGNYEWIATPLGSTQRIKSSFRVPQFLEGGIQILEPLIGGLKTRSNEYTGVHQNNFDLTLRWKPQGIPLSSYRIRFFESPTAKPFVEAKTNQTQYVLAKNKVLTKGKLFYRIDAPTREGFLVMSPLVPFQFDYVPPIPVNPQSKKIISKADLLKDEGRLLFTWKKTNFTEYYELEIALDEDFEKMSRNIRTAENFHVMTDLVPGRYWWRVRSFANGVHSPATPGSEFTLKQ